MVLLVVGFVTIAQGQVYKVFQALDEGDITSVQAYIDNGEDLNALYKGKSLLIKTIEDGHFAQAKSLINNGADLNKPFENKTPLVYAVIKGNKELVDHLIDNGARIDRAFDGDFTLAQVAARNGHHELSKYILSK